MKRRIELSRVRMRRATGRCEGCKPYGTRPGEADVVVLIHKLRRKLRGRDRLSFAAIAEQLNTEGHPSRTGKPWAPETVRQIASRNA